MVEGLGRRQLGSLSTFTSRSQRAARTCGEPAPLSLSTRQEANNDAKSAFDEISPPALVTNMMGVESRRGYRKWCH